MMKRQPTECRECGDQHYCHDYDAVVIDWPEWVTILIGVITALGLILILGGL